jgi:hypothetical protein
MQSGLETVQILSATNVALMVKCFYTADHYMLVKCQDVVELHGVHEHDQWKTDTMWHVKRRAFGDILCVAAQTWILLLNGVTVSGRSPAKDPTCSLPQGGKVLMNYGQYLTGTLKNTQKDTLSILKL